MELRSDKALTYLCEGDQSLCSQYVLHRANGRYRGALRWAESTLELSGAASESLGELDPSDRCFALRSGASRSTIDRLTRAAFGRTGVSQDLQERYDAFAASLRREKGISRHRLDSDHGWDWNLPLTDPYPFVTSAWVGGEGANTYSVAFNEARLVQERFNEVMAGSVGAEPCVLRSLDAKQMGRIEEALLLLEAVHVHLPHEIALHVRHICQIDYARWPHMGADEYRELGQSVSSHEVPSACFLSGYVLSSIPLLAESIYHEALHKKLSNSIVSGDVLRDGYSALSSRRFLSYWNSDSEWNSNHWEFDRALYAFHVYAHLFAYYDTVLDRGESLMERFGLTSEFAEGRRQQAHERSLALRDWLVAAAPEYSTAEGQRFLHLLGDWLPEILA